MTYVVVALAALLAICGSTTYGASIPVTLHSRGGTEGIEWPLTFGVPFPDKTLDNDAHVRLVGPDGSEVPIQVRTTGRWLGGSIRWVLIDAQAPLPRDRSAYRVEWGDGVVRNASAPRVRITDGDQAITIDTGPLRFMLAKLDMRVFAGIHVRTDDGEMQSVFPDQTHSDLLLEDDEGTVYLGSLAKAPEMKIEERGPLRVSIKLEGWMQSADGHKLGRRIVRVQAFAGQRRLRVYDTWVNTGDSNEVAYRNIAFHLPYRGRRSAFPQTPGSAPREVRTSDYLLQYEHDKYEIVSDGEVVGRGKRSPGRVTVGQGETAWSAAIRHFWQMCPREIEVNSGVLKVHTWPRHGKPATHLGENMTLENLGHLWWVHEGETLSFKNPPKIYEIYWNGPAPGGHYRGGGRDIADRANALGIALTSEYLLDVHGAADPAPAAKTFDANPLCVVDPQWLADSQAFWNIAPWREPYTEGERAAAAPRDFFTAMTERLGDYGMWNYGAYHKGYWPMLDGAKLHRHWMAFHHGGPRWPWLVFARSGDPHYFDFAEAQARHCLDVATSNWEDVAYNRKYHEPGTRAHLSLKYRGGMCKYNALVHWNYGSRMAYNSIVDYALWYYYMTGYQRAWDVAMMSGDFLLRFQDPMSPEGPYPAEPPVYKGRNGMGRGAMAITLYRATHDRRFLALAERQMQYFRKRTDGATFKEKGFCDIFYSPFVERYWEVTRDESLKPYIIKWARYWMDPPAHGKAIRDANALPGREHWTTRDTFYNLMALGYRLTGDEAFLEYGIQQARLFLETRGANADPLMNGVPLFSGYPGTAGYTAQQLGHFVKALEEHQEKTGRFLSLPKSPLTPMIGTPYRSKRLVFHIRKAEGEEVHIPFRFKTAPDLVTAWNPKGHRIVRNREMSDSTIAKYDFTLPADHPAGDYRVEFTSALLTSTWPPTGARYTKLVLERPDHFMSGVRICFMPRPSGNGDPVTVRLMTGLRPKHFQTHRLYRPDGSIALAKTLQLGPPHRKGQPYLVGEVVVPPEHQGKPWIYSRMPYGTGWLEGDVYPVFSFRPDEFFVPERFRSP